MTLGNFLRKVFALTFSVAIIVASSAPISAAESGKCRVDLQLSNTAAISHTSTEISVIVNNPADTILGFRIWLHFDRPEEVIAFKQSGPKFDTSGTLTSGWESISTIAVSGTGSDIQITGIANLFPPQ